MEQLNCNKKQMAEEVSDKVAFVNPLTPSSVVPVI
jgi:hypothetical protein